MRFLTRKKERIGVLVFPTEIGRSAALHSLKLVFGNEENWTTDRHAETDKKTDRRSSSSSRRRRRRREPNSDDADDDDDDDEMKIMCCDDDVGAAVGVRVLLELLWSSSSLTSNVPLRVSTT